MHRLTVSLGGSAVSQLGICCSSRLWSGSAGTFSAGLHPGRGVDGVPEQTVPRHLQTHHARTHGPCRGAEEEPEDPHPSTPKPPGLQPSAAWCVQEHLLTAVNSNPQLELLLRSMADPEGPDGVEEGQRHAGDLSAVQVSVPHRQP